MIDLRTSHEQETFAASLASVLERHEEAGAPTASDALWRELADVGFLGLCSPTIGGSTLDLVSGMVALGAAACPGPLVGTAAASVLLEGDELAAVLAAERRATLTDGVLVPWADECDIVLQLAADGAWRMAVEDVEAVVTLSGEPWARARTARTRRIGDADQALVLAELGLAAYLLGAADGVVERGADHARSRVQFRRPIGDFQAVAHPLARSRSEVRATLDFVRLLATGTTPAAAASAARMEAARVSAIAGDRVHQVMGAMGYARETGLAAVTMQVRQWSALPVVTAC